MLDKIVACCGIGMGIVASLAVYIILIVDILPRVCVKHRCPGDAVRDRGIRRCVYEGGRCVVYEPEVRFRRFVRQYELFCRDGDKYIKCMIHPRIACLRYQAAAFDSRGRLLDVLSVREMTDGSGYTRAVRLPGQTAYIRFMLREADGMYTCRDRLVSVPYLGLAVYAGLVVLGTVLETLLVRACLGAILERVSRLIIYDVSVVLGPALVLGLVTAVAMCGIYMWRSREREWSSR